MTTVVAVVERVAESVAVWLRRRCTALPRMMARAVVLLMVVVLLLLLL